MSQTPLAEQIGLGNPREPSLEKGGVVDSIPNVDRLRNVLDGNIDKEIEKMKDEIDSIKSETIIFETSESQEIVNLLDDDSIENVLESISSKIKGEGLFESRRRVGIDVWSAKLEDSSSPFVLSFAKDEVYKKLIGRRNASGIAEYDSGKILIHAVAPSSEVRLLNWVSGYNGDYSIAHEAIHGFQTANVKMSKEFGELDYKYALMGGDERDNMFKYISERQDLAMKWVGNIGIEIDQLENCITGRNPEDSDRDYKIRSALREAHSYWYQVNAKLINGRNDRIVNTLEGPGYGIESGVAKEAVECIKQLKALQFDDAFIGGLIFYTKIDATAEKPFLNLQKFINKVKDQNNVSDEDMEKLIKLTDLIEEKDLVKLRYIASEELQKEGVEKLKMRVKRNWLRFRKLFNKN